MPERGFKLGAIPSDPNKPKLTLPRGKLAATVPHADHVDYWSRVSEWGMGGNDQIGDCVFAAQGHAITEWTTTAQNQPVVVSDQSIEDAYSRVTGWPQSGDNGTQLQDGLNDWRKNGLEGHRIRMFAKVDGASRDDVRAAIDFFGNVYIGFDFPTDGFAQFDRGIWSGTTAGVAGGHCVIAPGFELNGTLDVVSWGKQLRMTPAFWDRYVFESWVVITDDWIDRNGHDPHGLGLWDLGERFTKLTGQPNPFPKPPPVPVKDEYFATWRLASWFHRNHPNRPHTIVFPTREAAVASGRRPCYICKP